MSSQRASLLSLPLEIFRMILVHMVRMRGLKRGLRLRLVNKIFQEELFEAFWTSNLLEEFHVNLEKFPWVKPYMERRLRERRTNSLPVLHTIRKIAEILAAEDGIEIQYESYALQLLQLACWKQSIRELLTSNAVRIGYTEEYFHWNLLSAAVFTNHTSLVTTLADEHLKVDWSGGLFGNPFEVAGKTRNIKILPLLFARMIYKRHMISKAIQCGDLMLVKHLLGPDCKNLDSWLEAARTARIRTREGDAARRRFQVSFLETPSIETFKFLISVLQSRQLGTLDDNLLGRLLGRALSHGWPEMVQHLINLGANPGRIIPSWKEPLCRACKAGRVEIVQLLLENGAKPCGSELTSAAVHGQASIIKVLFSNKSALPALCTEHCLYAAARKGFGEIVRLLLDLGIDPNKGESPLIGAVEAEHTGLFRMLIERGAILSRVLPEARSRAEDAGLESMLAVLNEYAGQD